MSMGGMLVLGERLHVRGIAANRQHASGDPRIDGLEPAIQHFGESGDFGNFAHRHACFVQRAGGSAGGNNLHAQIPKPGGEFHHAGFVRHADECTFDLEPFSTMVNVSHPVTLIPGDGIGPEVAEATVRAVNATGVSIDWQRADLNASIIAQVGAGTAAARD